jgi:hypothetical protein
MARMRILSSSRASVWTHMCATRATPTRSAGSGAKCVSSGIFCLRFACLFCLRFACLFQADKAPYVIPKKRHFLNPQLLKTSSCCCGSVQSCSVRNTYDVHPVLARTSFGGLLRVGQSVLPQLAEYFGPRMSQA